MKGLLSEGRLAARPASPRLGREELLERDHLGFRERDGRELERREPLVLVKQEVDGLIARLGVDRRVVRARGAELRGDLLARLRVGGPRALEAELRGPEEQARNDSVAGRLVPEDERGHAERLERLRRIGGLESGNVERGIAQVAALRRGEAVHDGARERAVQSDLVQEVGRADLWRGRLVEVAERRVPDRATRGEAELDRPRVVPAKGRDEDRGLRQPGRGEAGVDLAPHADLAREPARELGFDDGVEATAVAPLVDPAGLEIDLVGDRALLEIDSR